MVDITHKSSTLREAVAQAVIRVSKKETIEAVLQDKVPKGNVLEMSKTAGLFAVKKTSDMIPDCHPLPVESTSVAFDVRDMSIKVEITVKTIYKTGVEVEAMHGASVIALTIYDMLKPIDNSLEIGDIKLVTKKGGKSDFKDRLRKDLKAAVVVCSDTISAGKKEDRAGKAIMEKLKDSGVEVSEYEIIPDETEAIRDMLNNFTEEKRDLIIFTGGTGLSPRDFTPEGILPLLDREIPGIAEAIRSYGQQRTPFSMLSRSVAGVKGKSLVLALPGSTNGARESMDAIFPAVLHLFKIIGGGGHD